MFLEFRGEVTGAVGDPSGSYEENEWWIKVSRGRRRRRATTSRPTSCVSTTNDTAHRETVDGVLTLHDSPWDPYTELLPMREQLSADLVWGVQTRRDITLAGARPDRVLVARRHHRRLPLAGDRGGPRPRT